VAAADIEAEAHKVVAVGILVVEGSRVA